MFIYYVIFIASSVLEAVNNACLLKKYQLKAGTSLCANVLLMIVNGILSALVPAIVLLISHEPFEITVYSLIIALATVLCAALCTFAMLKVYESGGIAIANAFYRMGFVLISCIWGILFLKETVSLQQTAGIFLMIAAILLITVKYSEGTAGSHAAGSDGDVTAHEKQEPGRHKRILWFYFLIFLSAGFVNVFTKIHQIEDTYATVNTLSFSIWIGIVRVIVFALLLMFMKWKHRQLLHLSKSAYFYASATSVLSGVCYLITLIVAAVLPLTTTTPISMGISMGLTALLPWILYREKLRKQEIAGIILSILGIFLYIGF